MRLYFKVYKFLEITYSFRHLLYGQIFYFFKKLIVDVKKPKEGLKKCVDFYTNQDIDSLVDSEIPPDFVGLKWFCKHMAINHGKELENAEGPGRCL